MLIIGAGGCAKDLLAMLQAEGKDEGCQFYDDVNADLPAKIFDKYPIISSASQASTYFSEVDNRFLLGVGHPHIRQFLGNKFLNLGGLMTSWVSSNAKVGEFSSISASGVIIMHGAIITNGIVIEAGTLVNMHATLGHNCKIGKFCDIAPGVYASTSEIGDYCQLGINCVIKPGLKLGTNITVGAGSVVTNDVPDNWIVAGVPAIKIGENAGINDRIDQLKVSV
ncbi:MAG: acetyltransferase [Bacteroidota bacterium]